MIGMCVTISVSTLRAWLGASVTVEKYKDCHAFVYPHGPPQLGATGR